MANWKGTKGDWIPVEYSGRIMIQDTDDYTGKDLFDIDDVGEFLAKENVKLVIDAANTIQQCDLFPSELLSERDRFKELFEDYSQELDDTREDLKNIETLKNELVKVLAAAFLLIDKKVTDNLGFHIDLGTIISKNSVMNDIDRVFKKQGLIDKISN